MFSFFDNISILEGVYWASAIIGGLLFVLRLLLMLFGGALGGDLDGHGLGGHDGMTDVQTPDGDPMGHAGESDVSFRMLSFQGIAAFFMMFGLAGLTLLSTELHQAWVILGSMAIGVFAMWSVSQLYRLAFRLQSEGNIRIESAVGQTGRVYLRIPAEGTGQVQVSVQGSLREFDAVSADNSPIASGVYVQVEAVLDVHTLVVRIKS